MIQEKLLIINDLGLHARAAAQLVRTAQRFSAGIKLTRIDRQINADAKSILSVLTLAAPKGTEILVEIAGTDENAALEALKEIFQKGFGEI